MQSLTKKFVISLLLAVLGTGGIGSIGHAAESSDQSRVVTGTVVSIEGKIEAEPDKHNANIGDAAQVKDRVDKVKEQLKVAEQQLKEAKRQFLDVSYSSIESKLMAAKSALIAAEWQGEQRSLQERGEKLAALERTVLEAYCLSLESRKVEVRGIWIEPVETNVEQVREHLQKLKSAHLNAVYLPAKQSIGSTREALSSTTVGKPAVFDPVQAYAEEGAKLGFAVFAVDRKVKDLALKHGETSKLGVALTDHPVWNVAFVEVGENAAAAEQLLQQQRTLHAEGIVIVDEQSFFHGTMDWQWWMGMFRSPAALPDYRLAQSAGLLLDNMSRKISTIYVPLQGMGEGAVKRYKNRVEQMSTILHQVKQWDTNSAQSVNGVLNNLKEEINRDRDIKDETKLRLSFDIDEAMALLDAYLTQ